MALKNQVRAAAADVEIIPQESPPGDHRAAGAAENTVKRVKGLARTHKAFYEEPGMADLKRLPWNWQ
eukprot:3883398-Amphidinium_carterae.3